MELNFVKDGNVFIAEFEVAGDFNLHVERKERGIFSVYQRTALNGKYAYVEDFGSQTGKDVIEYDFTGVIYPKMIKIVSEVNPTTAEVISTGEVTDIKSQSKEIEVTANGTTEVTPDAGFAYLNSVTIKTNVPQSGEGGGTAMEYLDMSGGGSVASAVATFSTFAKVSIEGTVAIAPTYILAAEGFIGVGKYPIAVAIDFSAKVIFGEPMTLKDLIISQGLTADQLASLPRISKEQFYETDPNK